MLNQNPDLHQSLLRPENQLKRFFPNIFTESAGPFSLRNKTVYGEIRYSQILHAGQLKKFSNISRI